MLSSLFWGYFTTQLPAGFLSDTHGGDIVVLWSVFGCGVFTLAVPFITTEAAVLYVAPSILLVLFSRVCLGFSQGKLYNNIIVWMFSQSYLLFSFYLFIALSYTYVYNFWISYRTKIKVLLVKVLLLYTCS